MCAVSVYALYDDRVVTGNSSLTSKLSTVFTTRYFTGTSHGFTLEFFRLLCIFFLASLYDSAMWSTVDLLVRPLAELRMLSEDSMVSNSLWLLLAAMVMCVAMSGLPWSATTLILTVTIILAAISTRVS